MLLRLWPLRLASRRRKARTLWVVAYKNGTFLAHRSREPAPGVVWRGGPRWRACYDPERLKKSRSRYLWTTLPFAREDPCTPVQVICRVSASISDQIGSLPWVGAGGPAACFSRVEAIEEGFLVVFLEMMTGLSSNCR